MKRQLFLYLFILSALINVFTYVYFTKSQKFEKKQLENSQKKTKDSINILYNQLVDANYFDLQTNDNAKDYFYNQNIDVEKLMPVVKDALLEFNTAAEGNKYIDQPPMNGKKFIINKIKLLNHRWIIADYSNGDLWGEVLLKYFVNDDNTISFETLNSYLYPKQQY